MDFSHETYIIKRKQPTMRTIVFQSDSDSLFQGIRTRVDEYFAVHGMGKTGNTSLYIKSVFMLVVLFCPFIISWWVTSSALILFLALLAGLGMAGVGMNIMHDAGHGTYHSKPGVNRSVFSSMFIITVHPYNWHNQHNVAHHNHTNIDEHDHDIESGKLFRFTKEQEWKPYHRFQAFYAVFLYSMTTLMRAVLWDFTRLRNHFRENPNISIAKKKKEWATLISLRALYFFFWVGVPILFGVNAWYVSIVFFLVMHLVCGLILTLIFQTAHVVPKAETYTSVGKKDPWVVHQLQTTCNFATDSKVTTWLVGGLNFQKEHHLFPKIGHIHYPNIAKIVRDVCGKYGIEYKEYPTIFSAVWAHFTHLYRLGRQPA